MTQTIEERAEAIFSEKHIAIHDIDKSIESREQLIHDLLAEREKDKAEIKKLRCVIQALLHAKSVKENEGKSPAYEALKNAAWENAKQAIYSRR